MNTPYSQETQKREGTQNEHLYSASTNEIDEKRPELKDLPPHLEYAYLKGVESCSVIVSSKLTEKEEVLLLRVLEKRKRAIAWKMSDIKGISPSFCTHKILIEESFKPVIQPRRRLNLKVQDVVKNEIVRLLDSGLIYPISDSPWVEKGKRGSPTKNFLENLKQLHMNISFTKAIAQMPKYAKFLKGLLSNKTKLEEDCTVTMNERCSAVLLNKLPYKEKDPGSFTIPCKIRHLHIDNALADLGASETQKREGTQNEHLYSASANEIDEKRPELKDLPPHLEYAYLKGDESCSVIVSSKLTEKEEVLLLRVLEKQKRAIAWKMSDIKGISLSFCTHKILIEESFKPIIQPQRRLNLKVQDVVKNEIIRLLDSGLIYPISDSPWVSPIYVVPKKRGMAVVLNDNNELIPSRTVTGWSVCIDYRKLNDATQKDHFPLPFIDQMLERLSRNEYYSFLDGFSGFFQIPITPEDQEKTTFTCPYGTFTYRRMPFGFKKDEKRRLIRWILLLQGFNFKIKDKKGAKNLAADHLSRLENPNMGELAKEDITDKFPDEHLMILKSKPNNEEPWYADYVSYIVRKVKSRNISSRNEMPQNNILVCEVKAQALPTNDALVVIKFLKGLFARFEVKEKQENDKIETKPDKNGKRGKVRQCQRPITVKKARKKKKIQVQGTKNENPRTTMVDNRTMAEMLRAPTKGCVEAIEDPPIFPRVSKVPPPPVQKHKPPSHRNFVVHTRDSPLPNISYPSRMLKQKQQEKDEVQIQKFWHMFKQLHLNITLAKALLLMPKYQKMLKALLSNKEKLQELANTPLNENCSAVILKKLPAKLGDPGKFIIPCGFSELKCKAPADLGASINLMPLSVWKVLGLPDLIPTRMTLELANRAICTPDGIARDVFVPIG
nr:putative reverse transcriptase domain-containing protein [Tanacetum cinerariifolium]